MPTAKRKPVARTPSSQSSQEAPKVPRRSATAKASSRTVRFPDSPVTATATRYIPRGDLYDEIQYVEDTLIQFFKTPISEITKEWGQHFKGREDTDAVDHARYKGNFNAYLTQVASAQELAARPADADGDAAPTLYQRTCAILVAFRTQTPQHLLLQDVYHTFANRPVHVALVMLMRGGLRTFFSYNHCRNACPAALDYPSLAAVPVPDPNRPETQLYAKQYGVDNADVYGACNASHRRLEAALGINDIRYLDALVREASAGKCSLAFATAADAAA